MFLGDYIYEYIEKSPTKVRAHSDGVEATTLPLYRNRYAQYRTDPDLQRLHAEVPCIVTWDDHEVQNDYADKWSQTFDDPARVPATARRRLSGVLRTHAGAAEPFAAARPRHARSRPVPLLAARRDLAARRPPVSQPRGLLRPARSRRQSQRIRRQLSRAARCRRARCSATRRRSGSTTGSRNRRARWNLIAQDVLMAQLRERTRDGDIQYWVDDWNGYPAARQRLISHLHAARVANPVVLTGDIHSFWANDLKLDFDDAASPVVATELVGTSVSAHPPPYDLFVKFLPDNPHVRYFESRKRGYATLDIDAKTHHRALSRARRCHRSRHRG